MNRTDRIKRVTNSSAIEKVPSALKNISKSTGAIINNNKG